MQAKPLIFGADLGTLQADPNPAIQQICKVADGASARKRFARAVVANLKSPRALLDAVKALKPKPGTTTAKNAARLEKTLRASKKPITKRETNAAKLNAIYRKPSL